MITLYEGHALAVLRTLPSASVQCCLTSPPYFGLRAYGTAPQVWDGALDCAHHWEQTRPSPQRLRNGQGGTLDGGTPPGLLHPSTGACCLRCHAWQGSLGLEPTHLLYIQHLVDIFREVRRVLRPNGVCWVNVGDSYAESGGYSPDAPSNVNGSKQSSNRGSIPGHKQRGIPAKNLLLIPQRLAIALQDDGWIVRQVCPWIKRNAMPESVRDRPTRALEWWLMLTQQARYFCDMEAVRQVGSDPDRHRQDRFGGTNGHTVRHSAGSVSTGHVTRTYRNTDLWLQSLAAPHGLVGVGEELVGLDVPTQAYGGDHYATFAVDLIEPLLRMGTSAHGACSVCGAPWQRVFHTEKSSWAARKMAGHPMRYGNDASGQHQGRAQIQADRPLEGGLGYVARKTMQGWTASCLHRDAPRVPCVVLDPFGGRMTTLLAAQRLGLSGIGVELNPQDIEQGAHRLRDAAPLLAQVQVVPASQGHM